MLNEVLNEVLSSTLYVHMFGTAGSTKVQCSTCTACFLLFPWQPYCPDTSWCCPYALSGRHVLPLKRVWISSIFFLMKVDDTQTLMIFLRKRWIGPLGRQGKKSTQYFCTTYGNNYGQMYNVRQLEEIWNARESGAAMAASATCTSSLFYGPRLLPLSGRCSSPEVRTLGNFLKNVLSGDFCFEADAPHIMLSAHTMSVSVSTVMWGCGVFDSTLWLPVGNEGETVAL